MAASSAEEWTVSKQALQKLIRDSVLCGSRNGFCEKCHAGDQEEIGEDLHGCSSADGSTVGIASPQVIP
jgi:hypothetical protein